MFTCENQWNAASRAAEKFAKRGVKKGKNRHNFGINDQKIDRNPPIHIQSNTTTKQSPTQDFFVGFGKKLCPFSMKN